MKKHIALTALALILVAPGLAHAQSTSAVSRTSTVVERAAQEQGFEAPAATSGYVVPSLATMAPEPPAASAPAAPSSRPGAVPFGSDTGSRPSMVTNGLPAGLVMNGPGTEEYKKKHRKKKKKAAAPVAPVEQAAPVESSFAAPEPTPEPAPAALDPTPAPAPEPAPVAPPPSADIPPVPQGADPAGNGDLQPGDLGPGGIEPPAPLAP
ncbi:MAG: hypothetical protein ACAH80_08570 [Alphaproteobacteria bacterium]